MSDDMEMGALLSLPGGVGRCAVDGLLAGVDLCLVCHSEEPQREVIAALAGAIAKDERARKNAAAAHARLDDLCKRFVDGAETAEAKAEAFSLSRVDAEAIVGKSSDQERVERAVGVSRL
jgi:beta-N-acetylhexosaminidase|tara:strand:- start:456 stop:815 length:360 start_codon:yes stop_codon:yes gene_type:complete